MRISLIVYTSTGQLEGKSEKEMMGGFGFWYKHSLVSLPQYRESGKNEAAGSLNSDYFPAIFNFCRRF